MAVAGNVMSKTKAEVNRQGWESAEFPILCETCLGDNPYVRMMKEKFGKECKICSRPFTVFRWMAGTHGRFKKTEICQTCAKVKNVCQTCIFDLQYGLPVEVRDRALGLKDSAPRGDVNREYFAQNAEVKMEDGQSYMDYSKLSQAGHDMLKKLARTTPYYKRNQAHICSFFVKGFCSRGDECPYRHEMPEQNELTEQNIRDRYHGTNDPVAKKILTKVLLPTELPKAPEDQSITSVFVSGVTEALSENDLRDKFYAYGEIKSVHVVYRSHCAFITYTTREAAANAINTNYMGLEINNIKLRVNWGRQQQVGSASSSFAAAPSPYSVLMPYNAVPPPPPPAPGSAASAGGARPKAMPLMMPPPPPPPPGAPGYYFAPTTPDLGARAADATAGQPAAKKQKI